MISSAVADGGMWVKPHDSDLWGLHSEEKQFCAINYQDGYQNMILNIAIDPNIEGERAVWIFPVPSNPEETIIDIVKAFPEIRGRDIKREAKENIKGIFSLLRVTQIYPIPFELARYVVFGGVGKFAGDMEYAMAPTESLVEVHEHIEEYGLATELITAKDSTALWNYLALKDVELPEDSKKVFRDYIGEEYSFVVSWINDIDEFKREKFGYMYEEEYDQYDEYTRNKMVERMPYYDNVLIGVEVDFPTDRMYFPLKPTSVYGSQRVPAVIYVMDHVIPDLYPNIKKDSSVEYYYDNHYYVPHELENFFFNEPVQKDLEYTKITVNPPSKLLTDDLWMDLGAPTSVNIASSFVKYPIFYFFFFWIVLSVLASILAALIIFRKDRLPIWKFALWGLWNLLSIIGFLIATIFFKTKSVDPKLRRDLRRRGIRVVAKDLRKIGYVALFSGLFVGLTIVLEVILRLLM